MFNFLNPEADAFTVQQIARSMRRLGWLGVWLQTILGFMPILVLVSIVLSRRLYPFSFGLWLAIICLGILIFSIYWCFRYTRLAKRLNDRQQRPDRLKVICDLKLGLVANISSMAIAILIAMMRASGLTVKMLMVPPGATAVRPNPAMTTIIDQGTIVAPTDMIALQAVISTIAACLVGVIVALLLLHQVSNPRQFVAEDGLRRRVPDH